MNAICLRFRILIYHLNRERVGAKEGRRDRERGEEKEKDRGKREEKRKRKTEGKSGCPGRGGLV